jgi:DNA-directed RNA polymerase specialized sigma24 family protein
MDLLSAEHREVIVCRYYLDMPWLEVGEHLGRSEEAAQMLCHRALIRLKRAYGSLT